MALGERDPHSGHMTTGHEWNGIKELNTPVPRIAWIFLSAAALFALVYWILMPAWPIGTTYTKGLLGLDQKTRVGEDLRQAAQGRAVWSEAIERQPFAAIASDPALMQAVRRSGGTLFADNCSVCHGADAQGGPGYPDLTDDTWLWGGDPETVAETIRVGINANHPETRFSEMPAFGADQLLGHDEILALTAYLRSLAAKSPDAVKVETAAANGGDIFAENCAACHGEDARGNPELGAANLTDPFWLYGGDPQSLYRTLWRGRQGEMPAWEDRLSLLDRKILTLYLLDLGSPSE